MFYFVHMWCSFFELTWIVEQDATAYSLMETFIVSSIGSRTDLNVNAIVYFKTTRFWSCTVATTLTWDSWLSRVLMLETATRMYSDISHTPVRRENEKRISTNWRHFIFVIF